MTLYVNTIHESCWYFQLLMDKGTVFSVAQNGNIDEMGLCKVELTVKKAQAELLTQNFKLL